ncbi:MAG: acyltransferase [Elusimicrobiota bacterium]|nr:acyltransferase [Elusimicrobiota bacterium]
MKQKRQFLNVEFLRFALIWAVVLFHIVYHNNAVLFGVDGLKMYFNRGWQAVPMFFLMAGFFLFLKPDFTQSIGVFIKNKWLRFAPLVIATTLLFWISSLFGLWKFNWTDNILNMLLVKDFATWPRWGQAVHPAWYLSELLMVSVIYFGLAKSLAKKYADIVIAVLAFIGLRVLVLDWGGVLPKYGTILMHYDMARAFFFVASGYFLANAYKSLIFTRPPENQGKAICYGIAEAVLLFFVMVSLYRQNSHYATNKILLQILFGVLFWLFLIKRGWLSQFLNKNWSAWLGRYAYAIFVVHIFVLDLARVAIIPRCKDWVIAHNWLALGMICVAIMLLAMAGYHFVEVPVAKWIKRSKNEADK